MPRLFIAIDLPKQQRKLLETISCGLCPGTRWTRPDQFHLTLRFIGDVETAHFLQIKQSLSELPFSPFLLQINGLGQFPPRGKPNIIWAGVEQTPELMRLHKLIEKQLVAVGVAPEKRIFHPHITLARLPPQITAPKLADYLARNNQLSSAPFQVENFKLYSSQLTRNGPLHQVEETIGFQ